MTQEFELVSDEINTFLSPYLVKRRDEKFWVSYSIKLEKIDAELLFFKESKVISIKVFSSGVEIVENTIEYDTYTKDKDCLLIFSCKQTMQLALRKTTNHLKIDTHSLSS